MPNPHNESYLNAKRDKLGHRLHHQGLALDEELLHDEHEPRRRATERRAGAVAEYAICVATFYEDLAERLVNGATEAFAEHGVSPASVHTFEVPGAFELPLAAKSAPSPAASTASPASGS